MLKQMFDEWWRTDESGNEAWRFCFTTFQVALVVLATSLVTTVLTLFNSQWILAICFAVSTFFSWTVAKDELKLTSLFYYSHDKSESLGNLDQYQIWKAKTLTSILTAVLILFLGVNLLVIIIMAIVI